MVASSTPGREKEEKRKKGVGKKDAKEEDSGERGKELGKKEGKRKRIEEGDGGKHVNRGDHVRQFYNPNSMAPDGTCHEMRELIASPEDEKPAKEASAVALRRDGSCLCILPGFRLILGALSGWPTSLVGLAGLQRELKSRRERSGEKKKKQQKERG